MASDLKLDLDELTQLATALRSVQSAFDGADANAEELASAVGDSHLADAARGFADSWSHKRDSMAESVKALHDMLTSITENFSKLDGELATAIHNAEGGSHAAAVSQ